MKSYELYHFGIKGMRWGVRRFETKGGNLTPAGKRRYLDDKTNVKVKRKQSLSKAQNDSEKPKSNHRQKLEQKYRDMGLSERDAARQAEKRIKTEKIIAGVATMTVAAAAIYVSSKEIARRSDHIIKSGQTLQNIASHDNRDFNDTFYTTNKKSDMNKYKGILGKTFNDRGDNVYQYNLKAKKDMKVVSRKKAEDIFKDLYDNDEEFRKMFKSQTAKNFSNPINKKMNDAYKEVYRNGDRIDKKHLAGTYDMFNIGLVDRSPEGQQLSSKFYGKLKEKGYDAVQDINDKKYSGYNSKNPFIVFNGKDKIGVDSKNVLDPAEVGKHYNKEIQKMQTKALAEALGVSAAEVGAFAGGITALNKVAYNKMTLEYRKEHPNSKLTDAEIKKMLMKEMLKNQYKR